MNPAVSHCLELVTEGDDAVSCLVNFGDAKAGGSKRAPQHRCTSLFQLEASRASRRKTSTANFL
eukprot:3225994-Rhodomonas_salina.1